MVHMMHTKGTQVRERKRSAPRCCFQVMKATSNYNREIMSSCIKNTNNKIIRENEFECNMHADHDDLAITSKTNSW